MAKVKVRKPRDLAYLLSIQEGRVLRAQTIPDKRKQTNKELCRKPITL